MTRPLRKNGKPDNRYKVNKSSLIGVDVGKVFCKKAPVKASKNHVEIALAVGIAVTMMIALIVL